MDIIYHLADVHIPNNIDRHGEYRLIFNKFIRKLKKEERNKIVVICGDLYHDKTTIKPEALELAQYLIKRITNECELVIFDGNHDININNDKRMSSIDATIKYMKTKNTIHYLTENEIYEINDINFGLITMYSGEVPKILDKEKLNIALHHGTLYKSLTDLNHTFENEDSLKCQDFEDYDLVLLGDIHLQQYLNSKKTIAYSGSLIQQNYGEDVKKGYLKWDISDKENITSEYEHIPNDYVYKTVYIDNENKFKVENFEDVKEKYVRLRIQYKNLNKEELLSLEKEIKKSLKIISLVKEEISDTSIKTSEGTIVNKNFLDIYKDFIKEKEIPEEEIVTKRIEEIIKEFNIEKDNIKKEIKLKKLEFENLFSYGSNNKIDFESLHGINIVLGKNGLGKSSIIDIILFTLYDTFSRGNGKQALNIKYNTGYSKLTIVLNDIEYIITRKISSKNVTVKLEEKRNEYEKKNDEEYKDLSGSKKSETDEKISDLFGSYDNMIMTSIILQVGKNFIDEKANTRKNILTKILGLEVYDNIYSFCRSKCLSISSNILQKIEKKITNKNYDMLVEELNSDKEDYEEDIKNLEEEKLSINLEKNMLINENIIYSKIDIVNADDKLKEIEEEIENIEEEIGEDKYNKDVDKMNKDIEEIKEGIDDNNLKLNENKCKLKTFNINNLIELKEKKEEQKDIIIEIKKNIKEYELKIKERKEKINKKLKKLKIEKIENIEERKYELENNKIKMLEVNHEKDKKEFLLKSLKESNKDLLNHKFSENCSCCVENRDIHKRIGYLKRIEILEENINKLVLDKEGIEKIDEKIDRIEKIKKMDIEINNNNYELILCKNQRENIEKKINEYKIIEEGLLINDKIKENIEKINKEIKLLIIKKDRLLKLVKLNKRMEELNKEKEYVKNFLNNKDEYDLNKKRINELDYEDRSINIKIQYIKKKLESIVYNLLNTNIELKEQKVLNEEYKKNSEIHIIYKKILNLFEKGFREYVMKKKIYLLENKINNIIRNLSNYEIVIEIEKNSIDFNKIVDINKRLSISQLCGYERIVFNIAFRLALNNMNILNKNNFIIIDEGFSAADSDNIYKISYLIDVIKKEYDICLLISHIDEIKNQNGNLIKINVDINNDSKLNY